MGMVLHICGLYNGMKTLLITQSQKDESGINKHSYLFHFSTVRILLQQRFSAVDIGRVIYVGHLRRTPCIIAIWETNSCNHKRLINAMHYIVIKAL